MNYIHLNMLIHTKLIRGGVGDWFYDYQKIVENMET